jgi:hypothetical protein
VFGGLIIRKKRALFAALCLYSFLFWFYIAATIVVGSAPFGRSQFFGYLALYTPGALSFNTLIGLGSIAFIFSMVFMYLFLTEN